MALPNFPVPRELRDQIYGYLLDSAYTRVIRPDDGLGYDYMYDEEDYGRYTIQAYKFHTNILAVNLTIHDEAEEYLYKNNVFIVASLEWPSFATSWFGGMQMVPLVNAKHVARMQHHSLRLQFTPTLKDLKNSAPGFRAGDKVPITSFLLLHDDLRALCNTMRYRIGSLSGFAVMIPDNPRWQLWVAGANPYSIRADEPASMEIQLRDTRFRAVDAALQRDMLDAVSTISCCSMRVTLSGAVRIEDAAYISRVKDLMGPTLLSRHAAGWADFESLREAKDLADGIARLGELQEAALSYEYIYGETWGLLDSEEPISVTRRPIQALRFDVMSTLVYLEVKRRRLSCLGTTAGRIVDLWDMLRNTRESSGLPSQREQSHLHHLLMLCDLYALEPRNETRKQSLSVDTAMALLTELEPSPHILHDLAILEKVPDKNELVVHHLPIEECAAFKLPLPHFTFHQNPHLNKQPDYIVGRQNLDALRRLDSEDKEYINWYQKEYGQKITTWE